jgi:sugar/nucleoside kinase (ribokinase family)
MSLKFDAVTAGHICLDVIPDLSGSPRQEFARLFAPGRLLEIGPMAFATGGPVANTGLTLNRLGTKTRLMGKVGDDSFGETVRQLISTHDPHLAEGMVVDSTAQTSYTVVINPPQVDRIFLHFPGANDTFTADDVHYDLVAQARHFHLGYPPIMKMMYQADGAELAEIFRRVKQTGVTTSLDMALPDPSTASGQADWPAILAATLPNVDIFLPSGEEILYMLRPDTFTEFHQVADGDDVLERFTPEILTDLSQKLLDMGVAISCIKLGYRGFYMHSAGQSRIEALGRARPSNSALWAGREMWAPAFLVDEVGATGAGDASIAGFLSALLRDLSPEEVLTMATAVGAYNVEAPDGLSGIRPWDETWRRIDAGWPKRKLVLDASGWQFDDRHQLFLHESDSP